MNQIYSNDCFLIAGGGSDFWRIATYTHMLIVGSTGSGKTVAGQVVLLSIYLKSKHLSKDKQVQLIVADPKNDWNFAKKSKNVYQNDKAIEAVDVVFEEFEKRKNDENRLKSFLILWIDELNSLVESIDNKKIRDEFVKKVRLLLFQSRFVNIRLIVLGQTIPANVLGGSDARSQFDCVLVFNVKNSLNKALLQLSDEEKSIDLKLEKREAFWSVDGCDLKKVKIRTINDFEKLYQSLVDMLSK